jgi:PhnB protein
MQDVIPMLAYENGIAALEWLKQAFGFEENMDMRMLDANGRLTHAELKTGRSTIMVATPTPEYESINKHREHCKKMDQWLTVPWVINGLLVYVKDVEEHFKKAVVKGAEILSGIEEGFPGKRYRCADIEGHRWMFMEKAEEENVL